jgi:hypothetical protein
MEIKKFLLFSQNFAVFAKISFLGLLLLTHRKNWQDGARLTIMRKFWGQF